MQESALPGQVVPMIVHHLFKEASWIIKSVVHYKNTAISGNTTLIKTADREYAGPR